MRERAPRCPAVETKVGSPVLLHSCHGIILQHPVTKSWKLGKDFDYAELFLALVLMSRGTTRKRTLKQL